MCQRCFNLMQSHQLVNRLRLTAATRPGACRKRGPHLQQQRQHMRSLKVIRGLQRWKSCSGSGLLREKHTLLR